MQILNWRGELIFEADGNCKSTVVAANEQGISLQGANLHDRDLFGADLRDADLRGADLRWTILVNADLSRAQLYGANLRGADLRVTPAAIDQHHTVFVSRRSHFLPPVVAATLCSPTCLRIILPKLFLWPSHHSADV